MGTAGAVGTIGGGGATVDPATPVTAACDDGGVDNISGGGCGAGGADDVR